MRWLAKIALVIVLLVVVVFAAFNSSLVEIDGVAGTVHLPLGVALVAFFAVGCLVGSVGLYLAVVLRLKRELRLARRATAPGQG
jgi:uncharacterized integral membrane protein